MLQQNDQHDSSSEADCILRRLLKFGRTGSYQSKTTALSPGHRKITHFAYYG